MREWTLEGEIEEIAGAPPGSGIYVALRMLGVEHLEAIKSVRIIRPWERLGGETFIYEFAVDYKTEKSLHFVLKACVSTGYGSLTATMNEWVSRRRHLANLGVSTPRLYGFSRATLLEEYVPHELVEFLDHDDSASNRAQLLEGLARTGAILQRSGYRLISAHDWRTRGTDVVVVDFGSDLGSPGPAPDVHSQTNLVVIQQGLLHHRVRLSTDEVSRLKGTFYLTLAEDYTHVED